VRALAAVALSSDANFVSRMWNVECTYIPMSRDDRELSLRARGFDSVDALVAHFRSCPPPSRAEEDRAHLDLAVAYREMGLLIDAVLEAAVAVGSLTAAVRSIDRARRREFRGCRGAAQGPPLWLHPARNED
jgi:hypothetical protein